MPNLQQLGQTIGAFGKRQSEGLPLLARLLDPSGQSALLLSLLPQQTAQAEEKLQLLDALVSQKAKQVGGGIQQFGTGLIAGATGQPLPAQQTKQQSAQQGEQTGIPEKPQTEKPFAKMLEESLDPLQDNILKTVKKVQKDQVSEAMQAGVPPENILQQAGIQLLKPKGLFTSQGLTPEGNIQLGGPLAVGGQSLQDIQLLQQLLGQQPLQPKDVVGLQQDLIKQLNQMDKEGSLKPNDLFQGFERASNEFVKVRDSFARVQAAGDNPSAAGDLALIFNYMKILDPGSTVREGEFANAQNSAGIPDRIRAAYNSVISGKRLSPKQRIDFINRAQKLFQAAEEQQAKTTKEFRKLAKKNDLDPSRLFRDVGFSQANLPDRETISNARLKGAVGYDSERNVFVDANGNEVQ